MRRRLAAALLLALVASPAGGNACIVPKHKFASTKINTVPYNELPLGIGPFKYKLWKRGDAVAMEPDPLYFGRKPKLQRIILKIIPDRKTTLRQLTTHHLDLWQPVPLAFVDRVKGISGIDVIQQARYTYDHIDLNISHVPPPGFPFGVRAKNRTRLEFTYASGIGLPDTDQQIELIRSTWKEIVVDFSVRRYLSSGFFAAAQNVLNVYGGKFDITNFGWSNNSLGDLSNIYACDRMPPKGQNIGRYCNPTVDKATARFATT
ncbi:MAG: hypothetical protein NVSMB5_18180 [Candidatus Velthaea sp.]